MLKFTEHSDEQAQSEVQNCLNHDLLEPSLRPESIRDLVVTNEAIWKMSEP
jgi:hypothetical protein